MTDIKCTQCGSKDRVLQSNNPLVGDICEKCVQDKLDHKNIEHADFFCRTMNVPLNPEVWINMAEEFEEKVFYEYIEFIKDEEEDAYLVDGTKDIWKTVNEEWSLIQTHTQLIANIQPIKEGFKQRNKIKWGEIYTFEELIMLENLFVSTLKANDVSNPMQKDAIKKACKISVQLDRAISDGDAKEINDLSKSYQNFIKSAKIDDLITAADKNVISNVAQLVEYIEEQGFEFTYYDDVDRDIVDTSLKEIQDFIQKLVIDTTGLDRELETISKGVKVEDAKQKDKESFEKISLEELRDRGEEELVKEIDDELESDDIEDLMEDDEDEFF